MAAKKKSDPVKAVVYARYSSHNQGEQSIEGQIAAAQGYAKAKGYTIIHEYIDRAMTGRNDDRPEFQKMLSDCAKKKFSVIIVWKVDRFGRNREEITFNKYRAKKHGVRVEYVAENLPDSPEGVILESVLEGMAEYYSLQLSQNVRRGLLESAKKHQVICGKTPLGYKAGPNKEFVVDPDTAPTVKIIFDMYAEGNTVADIVSYLNNHGYRTRRGTLFTKNSLHAMLKNEKYIGIYTYKDIIRDEGAIPAIIDRGVFDKVQDMLGINREKPARKWNYADYVLTDKLHCGLCGSGMIGVSGFGKMGVKYSYYTCTKKKRTGKCKKAPIRQEILEDIVLSKVSAILQDDNLLEFIAERTWQYYLAQDTQQEELKALQKQLSDVENSLRNLVKSIEAGILSEMITSRITALEAQRDDLKAAIAGKELAQGFRLTKDHILYFLTRFRDMDISDRDCQKRLVETFVNSIFLYEDRLVINFNYSEGSAKITLPEYKDAKKTSEGFDSVRYSREEGAEIAPPEHADAKKERAGFDPVRQSRVIRTADEPARITITWFLHVFSISIPLEKK